MVESSTTDS